MTIDKWLRFSRNILKEAGVKTFDLDSVLLLEHALKIDRTTLFAHPEKKISTHQETILEKLLADRAKHTPIAYITGYKEFYARKFKVNQNVLIPRPETELVIEVLSGLPLNNADKLLDIGTGSGNIGISAKLEFPFLKTYLLDNDSKAIAVAKSNAKILKAKVEFICDDFEPWVEKLKPKIIVANLPYLPKNWHINSEAKHEPPSALFAKDQGLELIKRLITTWENTRGKTSFLILECEAFQKKQIIDHAVDSSVFFDQGLCLALKPTNC